MALLLKYVAEPWLSNSMKYEVKEYTKCQRAEVRYWTFWRKLTTLQYEYIHAECRERTCSGNPGIVGPGEKCVRRSHAQM